MLSYDVVDVFTDRAFAGNPVAVVHGADGLDDAQLLAIAREFNLSETTFPGSAGVGAEGPADAADGAEYAVRIFTPAGEIPFAGHPTLGTAWVLRQHGRLPPGSVVQHCGAGDIDVLLPEQADVPVRLRAAPRDLSGPVDATAVAEAVGLPAHSVTGEARVAGCGLSWVHLPVAPEALAGCRPQPTLATVAEAFDGQSLRDPVAGVNVYALDPGGHGDDSLAVRSRVFCPDVGVVEDPATGSAAVGLGIALVATGVLPRGGRYTIRQGVEMGRPSTLYAEVEAADGAAVRCEVGGGVVSAAAGTIAVPVV